MRRSDARILVLAAALIIGALFTPLSAVATHSDAKSNTVKSWYMNTTSESVHYDLGCALGDRIEAGSDPRNAVVIISYGDPIEVGSGWGTDLPGAAGNATVTKIWKAAEQYATGAILCIPAILRDHVSIRIGVGVTNNFPVAWGTTESFDHGEKWGTAVNTANNNLASTVAASAQVWGAVR